MKKLYFKEKFFKITDHYPILDENENEVYYLDQDFTFIGYKSSVKDFNGKNIFNINREIISFFPRYNVTFNDNTNMIVQQKFEFLKHKVEVYLDDETLNLSGNYWHLDFDIKNENKKIIGKVTRELFALTDTYELTILDENYTEKLIALVICLNNMIDLENGPCAHKRISGCGSGTEYMAITPSGELYPCHQFVGNDDFIIGDINQGIIRDDIIEDFKKCNCYSKEECKSCWANMYCSGGCAANNYNANGDINETHDYSCKLFKKRIEMAIAIKIYEYMKESEEKESIA